MVDRESAFSFEGEDGGTTERELVIAGVARAIADALDVELNPTSWSHTRKTDPGGVSWTASLWMPGDDY
jgi:hypothetical protein